jgi:hypothetical protein
MAFDTLRRSSGKKGSGDEGECRQPRPNAVRKTRGPIQRLMRRSGACRIAGEMR